ncbi:MAG: NAD(P)H-dependent oxidoreductase [Acetobacteraceae bacterium]
MAIRILTLNGSVRVPSRTSILLTALRDAIGPYVDAEFDAVHLAQDGLAILTALNRESLSKEGVRLIERVETADLLLVGTPVYRASYTGVLKHLFDLVRRPALSGKAAVLVASGGSPLHSLVIEHQLRPLLAFFNVHTAPTGIYASDADFGEGALANAAITERIARAAKEAAHLLSVTRGVQLRSP